MTYIEVKIKFDKLNENGVAKRVQEIYLADAMSCTEAEARVIEEITPFLHGEADVTSVKKSNVSEIFFDDNGDRFYLVKVNFITIDEKTAAEKKLASYILVQASDFRTAYDNFCEGMKNTMSDFEIALFQETPIIDVFRCKPLAEAKTYEIPQE